ncbi:MAG: protein kinase [Pleurocapsa sp.]
MQEAQTLLYNRYFILHIERTNSFNKVFFALDTYQNPPRSCVIKVFEPIVQKIKIAQWIEIEFQKEAKRLKQLSLNNRHLPQIYTYSNDYQTYYIVRELIEGETLKEKVQTKGKLTAAEVREILIKLLLVLKYLHSQGVIHQNIKPKNIILRDDDYVPMLINFGSIKQIVATYGFYGDKQMFASNNIYGYAPSEQTLGRSVPASDLYSLGLMAVYLLTAKNPLDLEVDPKSGNFQIPSVIASSDSNLAVIIGRATTSNLGDRYNSASEMLDDLLTKNFKHHDKQVSPEQNDSLKSHNIGQKSDKNRQSQINWWKTIIYVLGGLYIVGTAIIVWYDWNVSQHSPVAPLPEPSISLPTKLPELAQPAVEQPSMLNSQSENLIEIPIFATGTPKKQLREVMGEPNAIQKGYWQNSSAWVYKNRANGLIDLGYLFDLDTNNLRQTEVAIAPSVGLGAIEDILASLLQGKITPSITQELEQIYLRQANEYSFQLGDLKGSIERESDDHIYLGVWESDFH